MLAIGSAHADTYCVHSAFELGTALSDISTGGTANGSDHTII